jgi:predicted TPR repeat methyltransferase
MHASPAFPTPKNGPDPAQLSRRVQEMIAAGRVHAARPLMAALRRAVPPSAELCDLEARLLLREGRIPEALAELDAGLAMDGASVELLISRADARMQAHDVLGAAADASDAVILAPGHARAKAVLGVVLLELDRPADAVPCLRAAVAAEPRHAPCVRAYATALERCGEHGAAAQVLADGIRAVPGDAGLRTAAIMVAMRTRDFAAAADIAEAARQDGVADAQVFGLRGHALSSLGRHEEATEAYAEALKLAPDDPYVRHLVAAAGLLPQSSRAPAPYLEAVFDGYAQRFEAHLMGLQYRVPGLLRAALLDLRPGLAAGQALGPMLDLGCGTGLMGVVLSDLPAGPLTGVDVSDGMLREAEGKGLYASLVHGELEAFLARDTTDWPVILAADVFCYFGVLEEALRLCHARLAPGGLLLFTVEELQDASAEEAEKGWRLGRQGRFAHRVDYIERIAAEAGFALRVLRREGLRSEAGADVPGLVVALERVRHDG